MQAALVIDEIQSLQKKENEAEEGDSGERGLFEVQYGLIDMDWVNILNVFDQ